MEESVGAELAPKLKALTKTNHGLKKMILNPPEIHKLAAQGTKDLS
jgi:hypothetical protein